VFRGARTPDCLGHDDALDGEAADGLRSELRQHTASQVDHAANWPLADVSPEVGSHRTLRDTDTKHRPDATDGFPDPSLGPNNLATSVELCVLLTQ